ncbi:hypothetical protein [Amycolatopsis sp. cmx-4-83]|uniref:hypothetical protein n=1 Tax=Amycolatopsis sp. cmx-4-83 TaxID=2790940 RepID=UPI00397C0AF2
MDQDEAVAVLARSLRNLPAPALRRMAASPSPTTAAVARAILDTRADEAPRDHIFSS